MKQARYQTQVRMCAAEIQAALPDLAERHPPLILVAALTEHIRGGLFLTHESRSCAPAKARAMIRRMQKIAFADQEPVS